MKMKLTIFNGFELEYTGNWPRRIKVETSKWLLFHDARFELIFQAEANNSFVHSPRTEIVAQVLEKFVVL